MRTHRAVLACIGSFVLATPAFAGELHGKIDLPSQLPERPPSATRGFIERTENPFMPVRGLDVTKQMIVIVEGDEKPVSPPQVNWELAGESFARPVVAAPTGAEVVIKDTSKTARTIVAKEDPKLIPSGPINPTGTKSFRVADAGKVYTIGDKDAPHLVGRLVVVNTQFIAYPDEAGRFEITDIPPGSYKLRIWYRDGWMQRDDDTVTVAAKGKTDFNPKVPAGAFAPAAAKK
jgi:polysaccharide lyase family 4-like protein